MKLVTQFIYGNEVSLPFEIVRNGELCVDTSGDVIHVYRKTKRGGVAFVKTVNTYGELAEIEGLNLEPNSPNTIFINP